MAWKCIYTSPPCAVVEWKGEELGVWLKQLSPTLYEFYFSCFSRHDITGNIICSEHCTCTTDTIVHDIKH